MQSDITIPDLFLLEDIAAEVGADGAATGDRPNASALNKVTTACRACTTCCALGRRSAHPERHQRLTSLYRVSAAGCSCEAGIHGRACWHSALAEIILVARDRQGDDDDGDVEDGDPYETYAPPPDVG